MNEPILGKARPHGYDYQFVTLEAIMKLKEAAQLAANKFGYPVYLVGSVLYKEIPRDIDISIIMPAEDYEKMFGKPPTDQVRYGGYLLKVIDMSFEYIKDLYFCIDYHLDIKVCPDNWWPEKPKFLFASPENKKMEKVEV